MFWLFVKWTICQFPADIFFTFFSSPNSFFASFVVQFFSLDFTFSLCLEYKGAIFQAEPTGIRTRSPYILFQESVARRCIVAAVVTFWHSSQVELSQSILSGFTTTYINFIYVLASNCVATSRWLRFFFSSSSTTNRHVTFHRSKYQEQQQQQQQVHRNHAPFW